MDLAGNTGGEQVQEEEVSACAECPHGDVQVRQVNLELVGRGRHRLESPPRTGMAAWAEPMLPAEHLLPLGQRRGGASLCFTAFFTLSLPPSLSPETSETLIIRGSHFCPSLRVTPALGHPIP